MSTQPIQGGAGQGEGGSPPTSSTRQCCSGPTSPRKAAAFAAGDLLSLYRWINGQEYQRGDLTQWNWLFEGRHPDGLDRFRYAMWELRNIRQATQIMDVAASGRPERVLVVVGSSHKPHLDRLLGVQLTVRTVQLADLETAGTS